MVLDVIICPNVQVLLRWEGKSNYRTTCAGREGGKILRKQAKEPSSWCELLCSVSMTLHLERSENEYFCKIININCDIIFSNYVKCLNDHNTHCENIHKQFEKCLYFHQPRFVCVFKPFGLRRVFSFAYLRLSKIRKHK